MRSRLSYCLLAAVTVMGCAPAGDILEDRGQGTEAVTASAALAVSPDYSGFYLQVHGKRAPAASSVYPCDSEFTKCMALDSTGNTPFVTGLCPSDDYPAGDWAFDFRFFSTAGCADELATISCQPIPGHHLSKGQNTNWVECWTTNGSKSFEVCVVDPDTGAGRENCPAESRKILVLGTTLDPRLDPSNADHLMRPPIIQAIEELGFIADVKAPAEWAALRQADFAGYRALVLGDPPSSASSTVYAAASDNRDVWLRAIAGNVLVAGSDPSHHTAPGENTPPSYTGAYDFIRDSIKFATWRPYQTGLFVALGHTFEQGGQLAFMSSDYLGSITAKGLEGVDRNSSELVTIPEAFAGFSVGDLAPWNDTIHELVPPPDAFGFAPFAIATTAGGDTTAGKAFIIIRDVSMPR